MTKYEQQMRAKRLARESKQAHDDHYASERARFASLWGRRSPYANNVPTRRGAKSGKKTVQWVREHPLIKSNVWPSGLTALGLS